MFKLFMIDHDFLRCCSNLYDLIFPLLCSYGGSKFAIRCYKYNRCSAAKPETRYRSVVNPFLNAPALIEVNGASTIYFSAKKTRTLLNEP